MILFDIRVTTTVNWLGAPRCLRQMKRCYEQEETRSIASAPSKATMFLTDRSLVRVQIGLAIHKLPEHHQMYMQPSCVRLNPITILPI